MTMPNESLIDNENECNWSFVQVKGKLNEADVIDADIITSVVFNKDGNLLATGDRGGRVVVFNRNSIVDKTYNDEYNVYATFQSHEPDFDYLKSLDIEEKINKVCWLNSCNNSHFMLTTNDKTIKLFKIGDHVRRKDSSVISSRRGSFQESFDEGVNPHDECFEKQKSSRRYARSSHVRDGKCKRQYSNAHSYNIHSLSACCDGETFLSADDLRVNLWNIERNDTCFNIVDIKPENMEELTEVITCSQFHPFDNGIFVYSSSRGIVRLCDTRLSATCDSPAAIFECNEEDENSSGRFSEVVRSISDIKFGHNPRYLATRDFLSIRVWDMNMACTPVETYLVHDYLNYDSKLSELYENECIFDKFEFAWRSNSDSFVTGSYANHFNVTSRNIDGRASKNFFLEATPDLVFSSQSGKSTLKPKKFIDQVDQYESFSRKKKSEFINPEDMDFTRKISTLDWHPSNDIIALAATNNLYIFSRS